MSPSRASAKLNVLLFKVTKAGGLSGGKNASGGMALGFELRGKFTEFQLKSLPAQLFPGLLWTHSTGAWWASRCEAPISP